MSLDWLDKVIIEQANYYGMPVDKFKKMSKERAELCEKVSEDMESEMQLVVDNTKSESVEKIQKAAMMFHAAVYQSIIEVFAPLVAQNPNLSAKQLLEIMQQCQKLHEGKAQ